MNQSKERKKSHKSAASIDKKRAGFTDEERTAMKERAQELKDAVGKADGEGAV